MNDTEMTHETPRHLIIRHVHWLVLLFVGVAVTLRAVKVPLVYDECYTVLIHVGRSWLGILDLSGTDVNNHILNTLAIKLVYGLIGNTAWNARLPNILVFWGLLAGLGAWLSTGARRGFGLCASLLLLANPFLLDFFGLARGYGMACALLVGSVICLARSFETRRATMALIGWTLAALSVLASLCMLNAFLGLGAAFGGGVLWRALEARHERSVWRSLAVELSPLVVVLLVLAAFYVRPILTHHGGGGFYAGGKTGFWKDTVQSLVLKSLYSVPYGPLAPWLSRLAQVSAIGVVALSMIVTGIDVVQKRLGRVFGGEHLVLGAVGGSVILSVLQSVLLDVNYPEGRLALFFLPLMSLLVIYLSLRLGRPVRLMGYAMAALLAVHSVRAYNLTHTKEWKYDAETPAALAAIEEDLRLHGSRQTDNTLSLCMLFLHSITYYQQYGYGSSISSIHLDSDGVACSYWYVKNGLASPDPATWAIVRTFDLSDTTLYRRRQEPQP
jgi:hypothetical protein